MNILFSLHDTYTYIFLFMQTIEQAKSYFKRKVKFVTEQMEKVQMLGIEKSQVRDGKFSVVERSSIT